MPAKDIYHETVKNAMIKAGWTITHDPYRIRLTKGKNLFIDLGAEQLIAATKDTEKIAVEIKSFRRASDMKDLEEACLAVCFIRPPSQKIRTRTKALFSCTRRSWSNSV